MAYQFYISINGSKQGHLRGRKDKWMPAISFNMDVTSPRDIATGQASGKRQHKPITIGIEWGTWTPQIFSAMVNNEVLNEVVINVQGAAGGGSGKQQYEWIKLHNAVISEILTHTVNHTQVQDVSMAYQEVHMGTGNRTSATDSWELEQAALTFQKIHVSNSLGKTAAADSWTVKI